MSRSQQPIIIALGGNALQGGSDMFDFPALPRACRSMAGCAEDGLVLTHGNGPQVGQLAAGDWPLDMLGAGIEGMLGYILEQELGNQLGRDHDVVSLLTRTEVDSEDERLDEPVKPIGDWISSQDAKHLAEARGWHFRKKDGRCQRLVPSPHPQRTLQRKVIKMLLAQGFTLICAGGGGIPVIRNEEGRLEGIDAVIDKDLTSALIGEELQARRLILATDVRGVYQDWNSGAETLIEEISADEISELDLPTGSMGPKVEAACRFARSTGCPAVIGALDDLADLITGRAGTRIEHRQPQAA